MKTEADEEISDSSVKDGSVNSDIDNDPVYSYKEQRAIIHHIDRRLVVTLGLIYTIAQIDRGNLSNASIAGSATIITRVIEYALLIMILLA